MKKTRFIFTCLLVVTLVSCYQVTIKRDYDPKANFQSLKTYDWLPITAKAEINPINLKRIEKAVDNQLGAKGFNRSSENPDFLIAAQAFKKDKISVMDYGYDYNYHPGYPRGAGYAHSDLDVYQYEEGTLILDFIDTKSNEVIWRGSASAALDPKPTPEKQEKRINIAVTKLLKKFPPVPKN